VLDWDIKSTEQKNTFNNLFDFEWFSKYNSI
jgi:hypothetical protein